MAAHAHARGWTEGLSLGGRLPVMQTTHKQEIWAALDPCGWGEKGRDAWVNWMTCE
jgi:hypothetical protein